MTDRQTFFDLPNAPEEFGVLFPDVSLRKLDFSGLDYDTARRAIIEYIRTYYPNEFNDFVASNGLMMVMDIVSAVVAKLSLRADILSNEAFLPTATTEESVVNHLALINQRIRRQTPAIVDIECTIDAPLFTDLRIPAGTTFTVNSGLGDINYEIYRAPNDWVSDIIIPAGKRGVIAWGVEGKFETETVFISDGDVNQKYEITNKNILEDPIFVDVVVDGSSERWTTILEPIERYGSNDKVVEVNFFGDKAIFRFGDNVTGKAPIQGAEIRIRYRTGGGRRGRIGVGLIDTIRQLSPEPPATASVSVRFRNISASSGGVDKESIDDAKKRAPKDFAVQKSIVTASDYAQSAKSFNHPVFGSVSKSIATIRTSLNANRVEIYILAVGADDKPTLPSAGLKEGLRTYFEELNVLTDHVVVLDGVLKPVDIDMNVIVARNADASVVKQNVESVIDDFFDVDKWDMGKPFYRSNFVEAVSSVDGVVYVDVFKPSGNILPSGKLDEGTGGDDDKIDTNELIVEGKRSTNYYYEKAN